LLYDSSHRNPDYNFCVICLIKRLSGRRERFPFRINWTGFSDSRSKRIAGSCREWGGPFRLKTLVPRFMILNAFVISSGRILLVIIIFLTNTNIIRRTTGNFVRGCVLLAYRSTSFYCCDLRGYICLFHCNFQNTRLYAFSE